MSWLFGALQKKNSPDINFVIEEDYQKQKLDNLLLFVGGNSNTSYLNLKSNKLFAYVGVLLKNHNDRINIINNSNVGEDFPLVYTEFDGHYVQVNYSKGILNISNDKFGLRELYYYETDNQFIFSTRLDLIIPYASDSSINFNAFGSLWLTNFQLSHSSIFNKINRLGPSGRIICENNEIFIHNKKFVKSETGNSKPNFSKELASFCNPDDLNNKSISLALSGGIDSRLILSELLKVEKKFSCHTFINDDDKDLEIAQILCEKHKIKLALIDRDKLSLESIEQKVLSLYKHISPNMPITQLLDFVFYGNSYLSDKLILDGGFGGFYRRQYLNRIYLNGYSNLNNNDKVKSLLYAPKPAIFNYEISSQMTDGLNLDIINLIEKFETPKTKEELAEILDLISIQYMLPAIYSSGQISLDQHYLSYMPLVQENLINLGMNIPQKDRRDSIFIKNLIKDTEQGLERVHLVNNNVKYPYRLNYKVAMVKLLIHRKLLKRNNYSRYNVYINSRDKIYDLVNSSDFRNNHFFDQKNIHNQVEQFFNGNYSLGTYLDWALSFYYWSKANGLNK
ncbi:MAG: hypothetical protein OQJ81_08910 [Melioribacteraceae bacterium]|nr:hypothetical protein [Melioribacteraceae bacterium]